MTGQLAANRFENKRLGRVSQASLLFGLPPRVQKYSFMAN